MTIQFYDSHGMLWQTCAADDEGAEAFGPRGCARRVGGPDYVGARKAGRVFDTEDGWPILVPAPTGDGYGCWDEEQEELTEFYRVFDPASVEIIRAGFSLTADPCDGGDTAAAHWPWGVIISGPAAPHALGWMRVMFF